MNADERRGRLNEISGRIIGCAYAVANGSGCYSCRVTTKSASWRRLSRAGLGGISSS
jgi:hypothetical protein